MKGSTCEIALGIIAVAAVLALLYVVNPSFFAGLGLNMIPPLGNTSYTPPAKAACSYYDITDELYNMFGGTNMQTLERGCLAVGGRLTKDADEYSCYWNPAVYTIDCSAQALTIMESFCKATLKAQWSCLPGKAYMGCYCDKTLPPNYPQNGDQQDDGGQDDYGDAPVTCANIDLPQFGDMGPLCEVGYCSLTTEGCAHYWDYTLKIHKCGCTETYFCGQYCYNYFFTNTCDCPPHSTRLLTSRSTFMCVPDGYTCVEGTPVKE